MGVPLSFVYSLLVRGRKGWGAAIVVSTVLSALEMLGLVLVVVAQLVRE